MKARLLIFPVFLIIVLSAMSWLMLTNYQKVGQLQREGKNPITVATPGTDGRDGLPGPRGERGPAGVPGEDGADGDRGPVGLKGNDGVDGQDGLSIQGERGARGAQGLQGLPGVPGAVGATGSAGADGRTPTIGCVVRTVNNLPVNYIAWKYTNEADSTYRNLYRVPNWAQPEDCVNV